MAVLNTFSNPDPRAIDIAHALHQSGDTLLTVLFDFRARGDYAEDRSDVEILLVQEHSPSEDQQERVKLLARPWQCLVPGPVDSSAGAMDDPGGIRTGPAQRQSCCGAGLGPRRDTLQLFHGLRNPVPAGPDQSQHQTGESPPRLLSESAVKGGAG